MVEIEVKIKTDKIQLDQFLKWANLVSSGGEAKALIQGEKVLVNGKIEQRRARKIMKGDRIELEGQNPVYKVNSE